MQKLIDFEASTPLGSSYGMFLNSFREQWVDLSKGNPDIISDFRPLSMGSRRDQYQRAWFWNYLVLASDLLLPNNYNIFFVVRNFSHAMVLQEVASFDGLIFRRVLIDGVFFDINEQEYKLILNKNTTFIKTQQVKRRGLFITLHYNDCGLELYLTTKDEACRSLNLLENDFLIRSGILAYTYFGLSSIRSFESEAIRILKKNPSERDLEIINYYSDFLSPLGRDLLKDRISEELTSEMLESVRLN